MVNVDYGSALTIETNTGFQFPQNKIQGALPSFHNLPDVAFLCRSIFISQYSSGMAPARPLPDELSASIQFLIKILPGPL
jgi:hypothetical protein